MPATTLTEIRKHHLNPQEHFVPITLKRTVQVFRCTKLLEKATSLSRYKCGSFRGWSENNHKQEQDGKSEK